MLKIYCCENQSMGTDLMVKLVARDVAHQQSGRVLLVPELISHDMERRLCSAAGDTASRYAEVLSFSRLARRVMDLMGSGAVECLDEGGRILAMAAATRNLISKLKVYAGVCSKPDFLKELVDTIDECKRCCITPEQIGEAAGQTTGLLSEKLHELAMIMSEYDRLCLSGKRDPRDQMSWVLDELKDSSYAQEHTFYIDGFPDFSRQHLDILEHLIHHSPMVTVCLVCDGRTSDNPAFEKAADTVRELEKIAKRGGVASELEFLVDQNTPMAYVRRNLFQNRAEANEILRNVLLPVQADSLYQECQAAADRIQSLVQQGYRYRDIALVCTDLAVYRSPLRLIFRRCGIPLYLAGNEDVLQTGVVETVTAALDAALDGLDQRSVLHYLRSCMSPLSLEACDRLENYAIIWGISGKRWLEEWTAHPDGLAGIWDDTAREMLVQINSVRRNCIEPLQKLRQAQTAAKNLGQQVLALHDFLIDTQFPERLDAMAAQMDASGDHRTAQIYNQLWDILVSALEQMYSVLENTVWDGEDFSHLLRLMLGQYHVGTIPPVLDAVTAGNVSAMRCQREKHLLILGGHEGSFPASSASSGLFTDQERKELRNNQILLTGGSMESLQTEFAEIYCLFCGAEESVAVYCSQEPSFVHRRLCQMAGEELRAQGHYLDVMDAVGAAAYLVRNQSKQAACRLGIEKEYSLVHEGVCHCLGNVERESVSKLFGHTLKLSASQVDRQAECRLSYFLKYGLRAQERKEATVDPAEFGTYVHDVLEHTARQVMARGGFDKVTLEETLAIAEEQSEAYVQSHFAELDSQRMLYLFQRNILELNMVVEALWQELRKSEFVPTEFELQFDSGAKMPAIVIDGASMPAQLRGFVDRVDTWEHAGANYVRVVDYKTGKKDFDYCDVFNGVGLQMLLYLFALEDGGAAVVGEPVIPAGVQYFPARVPYITASGLEDPEWKKERRHQLVRKGLLLADEECLTAMDPSETMETLSCKRLKDGTLSGDLADRGQMLLLKKYVMHILRRIVDDIASGNMDPNPYTRGSSHNACAFCPYGAICHKSEVAGRRNYKRMDSQRFWEEVRKELGDRG